MLLTKYDQLKHGMRVKCTIKGCYIDDAKISIDRDGDAYICQNEEDGGFINNRLGYEYSWRMATKGKDVEYWPESLSYLRTADKTDLSQMEVGDILVNEDDEETKALAVLDGVFLKSHWNNFNGAGSWFTFEEAKEMGWKFKGQPEDVTELSLEEVAKLAGIPIDKLRIKE